MSEEILKALMQLFAIIAKQDDGVETSEVSYVKNFLTHQLSDETVEEYLKLFYKKAGIKDEEDLLKKREKRTEKQQLTSVKDSVRILGLCKKINKQLNQKQKAVVLVRLFELVNADRKFTDQRMAIINTVAEVFNVTKEEFGNVENFVVENDLSKLDSPGIMVVNDTPNANRYSKFIQTESLDGELIILQMGSVDLYFLRYTGQEDIFLNGLPLNNKNIYLFASGSTIKLPKGKPVYYSDVVANYMADTTSIRLSFAVEDVNFAFPNGELGLRNINFSEEHGKLIGIMGASGAGKTTMLNVLSGIAKPSQGAVMINGINLHEETEELEGVIGYIPQDDLLIEELTVFQNLYYNAKLCFNDKTELEIVELVNKTLKNLGLYERKDLKVGSPLNKLISGGQRKRLNIALELIREPSILFVDEPTSGLSSRDSENVMDLLRELTLKGKLIFVVIHQPSSDIYKMFDKMMILDTGGYMIYHGNPVAAIMYFKRMDNQVNAEVGECPTCGNVNPELIFNIVEAQVVDEFGNYTDHRKISPLNWEKHYQTQIELDEVEEVEEAPVSNLNIPTWIKQLKIYSLRDLLSKISNKQYVALTLLESPILALILSFIIRYIADPTSNIYIFRDNVNIPPYIFMSIIVALFLGLTVSAEEIFRDRKILKREAFLNLSRSSYLVSKVIILFVISAIQALLYVLIGNSILGVRGMWFEYWMVMFATSASANMMGLNISASFNSAVTIYILIPLLMIPQMALGGAMFSFDKLNRSIGRVGGVPLVAEAMTARWAYEAMMVHQFKENEFHKEYYDLEKLIQIANFKNIYYFPKLQNKIRETREALEDGAGENKTLVEDNLALIMAELEREQLRVERFNNERRQHIPNPDTSNNYNFPFEQYRSIDREFILDTAQSNGLMHRLDSLKTYYTRIQQEANSLKQRRIEWLNENYPNFYNGKRDAYHNEYLSEIVRKVFEKEKSKIVEYEDKLIQQIEPVYLSPMPDHFFDFRTHFYAPKKYFMGKYFNTFWFNIILIWVFTFILYVTLYFDLLKRTLVFFSELTIPNPFQKIDLTKIKTKLFGKIKIKFKKKG